MLTEIWRDIISIGGFLLTFAGLLYTVRQVWLAKSAADAAKDAAEQVLRETRKNYQRYSISLAHRFIHEVRLCVDNKQWDRVALRLNDLADQLSQLTTITPTLSGLADESREWAGVAGRLARGELKQFRPLKWASFFVRIQAAVGEALGPFAELESS